MNFAQKLVIGYYRAQLKVFARLSKRKAAEKAFELFSTPYPGKARKTPPVFEKAEKLHLPFNGLRLVGYRWNHPQPRRALILHGFSSTARKFDHFVMPLVKKGYEVLAFDAPAHGESGGKLVNAVDYKEMIDAVYRQYGPVHAFIAHSFGGLALSLFLEEQGYQENKKVVLIAPATETSTALRTFSDFLRVDEPVREELRQLIHERGGHWPEWYSIRRAMHNIRAEVLWVHDRDDDVTPWTDAGKVQTDGHPHVRFLLTNGLGHRRIYRDNQVKKAVLEFL
ncbi:MAG TPA: alpha/beta fold hydrolase [Lacibacter sp.]|nr:alpha/beta fold hydrolase [Lacibacter sp.]HMO89735.1 alpha/beta fold hydrolase [Lacibacter sp.]HMP87648.1 alpha/beta fold hydrolase [Lacibacter sp.]